VGICPRVSAVADQRRACIPDPHAQNGQRERRPRGNSGTWSLSMARGSVASRNSATRRPRSPQHDADQGGAIAPRLLTHRLAHPSIVERAFQADRRSPSPSCFGVDPIQRRRGSHRRAGCRATWRPCSTPEPRGWGALGVGLGSSPTYCVPHTPAPPESSGELSPGADDRMSSQAGASWASTRDDRIQARVSHKPAAWIAPGRDDWVVRESR
jgi:hypothetical protein